MRILMVPVAERPECGNALETAFWLAKRLQANVQACHVRPHRYTVVRMPVEAGFSLGDDDLPRLSSADEKKAVAASHAARGLVERLASTRGLDMTRRFRGEDVARVRWHEVVGDMQNLMPVIGPFADLIVVTRPRRKRSRIARMFMEEALLSSSRPVLILPARRQVRPGFRVVIAWDRTQHAMRAVVAALPVLRQAEEVSVIESDNGKPRGPKTRPLLQYLAAWGVTASAKQVRSGDADPVRDIEAHCNEVAADLLVMGSYSRSRLRERVLGGVTEHFLRHSQLPLLTIHA